MKRSINIFSLLICMLLLLTVAANAVEIKDVPEDHWAYESVKMLIEKGYLSLYEDGTFGGSKQVTRYELAELVAGLIENFTGGSVEPTEQDIEMLRKLSVEFRDELVDLASNQEKLSQQLEKLNREDIILKESIGQNKDKIEKVEQNVDNLQSNLNEKLSQIEKDVGSFNKNIEELQQNLNNSEENIDQRLETHEKQISAIEENINNIRNDIFELNKYKEDIGQTDSQVENISGSIKNLEDMVSNLNTEINNLREIINQREETIDEEAISNLEEYKKQLNETMQNLKDQYSVDLTRMNTKLEDRISTLEKENQEQQHKISALEQETTNYKLYLGAVALLALLIGS